MQEPASAPAGSWKVQSFRPSDRVRSAQLDRIAHEIVGHMRVDGGPVLSRNPSDPAGLDQFVYEDVEVVEMTVASALIVSGRWVVNSFATL